MKVFKDYEFGFFFMWNGCVYFFFWECVWVVCLGVVSDDFLY